MEKIKIKNIIKNINDKDKDNLFSLVNSIKPVDKKKYYKIAGNRLNRLIKPKDSLGRLEEFARDIIAITENEKPLAKNKYVCIFASDHGVASENISAFKQEVTAQMVHNFINGGAAINAISNSINANVIVVDIGVNADFCFQDKTNFIDAKIRKGSSNIFNEPAMSYDEAIQSIFTGIDVANQVKKKGAHICASGDMGIANTTPSSAIVCFYSGKKANSVCGHGTGVNNNIISRKAFIIERAINSNIIDKNDPISVLAGIGGFEIGAIAGFILGCALNKIPVVIDGFISTAGSLIAMKLNQNCADYMFMGHLSKEKGHKAAISLIKKKPILNLDMHLGEGTGAVIAMKIIEAACDMYNNMLTFDEANVFASKHNI
jgi:nicotinate-nucleotide--dimethylbenzimidazole phosphoribosyltransferase